MFVSKFLGLFGVFLNCAFLISEVNSIDIGPITLSNDPNDVHFYLYPTAGNPDFNQEILFNNTESLTSSLFQPGHNTVFIIHGFRSNISSEMPQTVKNAYLASGLNYNYIVVSWGALSTPLPPPVTGALYSLVTFNVPIVAGRVTDFIRFLKQTFPSDFSFDKVHMIGHSLGAHVSGLTGLNIQQEYGQKLARITGLDPAGPLFFPPISSRSLVKTDASFVDVIHTNMGTLGDTTEDGHADFYPNGGSSQTGCPLNDTGIPALDFNTVGRCSHWFSYKLYAASLTKVFSACECQFPGFHNLLGIISCPGGCAVQAQLGANVSTTASGQFYLTTTNPP